MQNKIVGSVWLSYTSTSQDKIIATHGKGRTLNDTFVNMGFNIDKFNHKITH